MPSEATQTGDGWLPPSGDGGAPREVLHLVLLWSMGEPARVGQSAVLPRGVSVLGRGDGPEAEVRVAFGEARPGVPHAPTPLGGAGLSRRQLRFEVGGKVLVENLGRGALRVNGRVHEGPTPLHPGDVVGVERQALFLVTTRDPSLFRARADAPTFAFGAADAFGIVGESPAAWILRDHVAFAAKRAGHVLVTGPSGSGKELCARAIHALSPRAKGPFVGRNAATLPQGLLDAEIFGHARNYPNAGMGERPGLVGEAEGGTLFLDEIGELPSELQAHLLRLLDDGEFHRLGESGMRKADVRLVAATNRGEDALKHDLAARLTLRVVVPSLASRREDVPLLARAILRRAAARDAEIAGLAIDPATGEPRIDPELVELLVRHDTLGEVREIEALLLEALRDSRGGFVAATPELRSRLRKDERTPPTKDEIVAALSRAGGNATKAFPELGLPSRDALYRLMRKHGLSGR